MFKQLYTTLLGFVSTSPLASSKRLIVILAYISAIGISWYSIMGNKAIETNELILVLSLAGIAVGNYAATNRNELLAQETISSQGPDSASQ